MQHKSLKASISIAGGFLTHLVMGAVYLWGNLSIYVTSYYHYNGYPDIQNSTVQTVFPFIYVGLVIGHFTGLVSARKLGHKLFSALNMVLYAGSFYVASVSVDFTAFVVFMGLLPGFCIGNEYLVPVDNAYFFYPQKKVSYVFIYLLGVIGGLILCGIGFGALVFNPLFQYIINPDNITPDETTGIYSQEIADRLPHALKIASLCYILIGMMGVLMMFQTTRYRKMEASLNRSSLLTKSAVGGVEADEAMVKITNVMDAFKTRHIYLMWIMFFSCSGFGFLMVSQYKSFGLLQIKDDHFFAIVGSLGGVANGLSRALWGALLDYTSPNMLISINILIMVFLAATMNLIAASKTCFMMWMIALYLQYGGLYTYFPVLSTKIYGPKLGPLVYNIVSTSLIFSVFGQFLLAKYFLDTLSYSGIFFIYCGVGMVALIIQMFCEYRYGNQKGGNSSSMVNI